MGNYIKERFTSYQDDKCLTYDLFKKCYVLAILPRSGSTWIGDLLDKNNLGHPMEYINETAFNNHFSRFGENNLKRYLYKLIKKKKRGDVWSIQLTYWNIYMYCQLLPLKDLLGFHPNWIYLRRGDIVSQGISLYRSVKSGYWHGYQSDRLKSQYEKVEYDSDQIKHWVNHILGVEEKFELFFKKNTIKPKRYLYEDLKSDPTKILSNVSNILGSPATTFTFESDYHTVSKKKNVTEWKERLIQDHPEFIPMINDSRPAF